MAKRNDKLISTKIAAEMLGFSQDYIRQLCAEGKITDAQKISTDWVFPMSSIKHVKRQRQIKRNFEHESGSN